MASGPTLPPQAYTREVLTAAFNWLQSQPESVKKLATNPDALVGLYLRAQRYGNSNLETDAPVSSQAFMNDLRNLAEGLKAFDEESLLNGMNGAPHGPGATAPPGSTSTGTPIGAPVPPVSVDATAAAAPGSKFSKEPKADTRTEWRADSKADTRSEAKPDFKTRAPQSNFAANPGSPSHLGGTYTGTSSPNANPYSAPLPKNVGLLSDQQITPALMAPINERSVTMIQEVKHQLNLTSDAETVNLMLALAYKNLKNLLP